MKISIFILIVVVWNTHSSCALQDVLKMGLKVSKIARRLLNVTTDANSAESMVAEFDDKNSEVGELLRHFRNEIDGIADGNYIESVFSFISNFLAVFPPGANTYSWVSNIKEELWSIDRVFTEFSITSYGSSAKRWETFAEENINLAFKTRYLLIQLIPPSQFRYLYPGFLPLIINESARTHSIYCKETSMMQQFLGHLLEMMIITELKVLMMLSHAMMVRYSEKEAWKKSLRHVIQGFDDRFSIYVNQFSHFMDIAPKDMTACNLPNTTWIRDETYFEIERIEQMVVFQYKSFFRSRDCDNAIQKNLMTYDSHRDSCSGTLSDCKYSGWLEVCRLGESPRRYGWIKSASGNYGMNFDKCPNGSISRYTGPGNWLDSHCICKCREKNQNWISLSPVKTDVANNMVVTGLRFVRKKGGLHLQVRQGKLLKNGWIDYRSQNWIPLPENPESRYITPTNKKFYLDDVILPEHYLAVGVQFDDSDGFAIGVIAQKFNYSTGELSPDTTEHIIPQHTNHTQLLLPQRNSIYTNLTHTSDSNKNWVTLEISDLKHDAGQSMLPLFDGVAIEAHSPAAGIGIFHKGVENYAGFIAPRLFPLQYREYVLNFIRNNAHGGEVMEN